MATSGVSQVRAWAQAEGLDVPQRGRLSNALIEAFNKANPRAKYEPGHVETFEHAAKPEQGGRTVKMQISVPAVRAWAKENGVQVGERGRLTDAVKDAYVLAQAEARRAAREAQRAQAESGE